MRAHGQVYLVLLRSFAGTFLRGVLDKVGVEPQVQRIGAYKSAGDQLLRRDMSDAQREQLGELLDDIYSNFLDTVAEARGKTREVRASRFLLLASRVSRLAAAAVAAHLNPPCFATSIVA